MVWFVAGFFAFRLLGLAFVVLLIARIVGAVRGRRSTDEAVQVAARRFAAGEITEEQLRRIRDALQS
ncbi:MAG TPA: hypothetical protein VMF68_14090 [Spirochaetia bacterium]|nr:hypothetical protein [Spirochaetia bacterium]HTZ52793.1 hypothetical protein [Spirochaetia bacterium]